MFVSHNTGNLNVIYCVMRCAEDQEHSWGGGGGCCAAAHGGKMGSTIKILKKKNFVFLKI
jgi:hypothetical protein